MKPKRDPELINAKCVLLMQLGFDIAHNDSSVYMHGVEFDFSATEGDFKSIMYEALRQMREAAHKEGIQYIRDDLKSLLGL